MLFMNRFEKTLFDNYIVMPFKGYSIDKDTSFFDMLCDFCASVNHNSIVFPNGINKRDYARVFYASYALGAIVSCSLREDDAEKIGSGEIKSFAGLAKQNGMSNQLIMERMSYITDCFDFMLKAMDKCDPDKQKEAVIAVFLGLVDFPSGEKITALIKNFDDFAIAFSKWEAYGK